MSSGRLQLVCLATGESLPLEEVRRQGFVISLERVTTDRVFVVPHRSDQPPPRFADAPEGVDAAEFFDALAGEVIRACSSSQTPVLHVEHMEQSR